MNKRSEQKKFDKIIRERYEGHKLPLSDNLWEKVRTNIYEHDYIKYKKRYTIVKRITFTLFFFLIGTIAFYEFQGNDNEQVAPMTEKNIQSAKIMIQPVAQSINENNKVKLSEQNNIIKKNIESNNKVFKSEKIHAFIKQSNSQTYYKSNRSNIEEQVNEHITDSKQLLRKDMVINGANSSVVDTTDNYENLSFSKKVEETNQTTIQLKKNNDTNESTLTLIKEQNAIQNKNIQLIHNNQITDTISYKSQITQDIKADTNTVTLLNDSLADNNSDAKNDSGNLEAQSASVNSIVNKETLQQNIVKSSSLLTLTFFFSPDYTYRFLSDNFVTLSPNTSPTNFNKNEKAALTFSTGLIVGYDIGSHWSVKIGANYGNYRQRYNADNVALNTDTLNNGYSFTTSLGITSFNYDEFEVENEDNTNSFSTSFIANQKLSFIHIPIQAEYRIGEGKTKYFVSAGLSTNFVIAQNLKINLEDSEVDEAIEDMHFDGIKPVSFSGIVGLGIEFNFFKGWTIMFHPEIRASISSVNKDLPIKSYPYSFGMATGLKYRF